MDASLKARDYSASAVDADLRALFGGLLNADWKQALVARGFGWHIDVGTFSTPITGGGNGTILDQDQPELVVEAPAGWTMIPLRIHVACQTPLIAADSDESEIAISVDRTQAIGATATNGTVETPINMRTDRVGGCPLAVTSACTTNTTNPTLSMDLGHHVKVGDVQGTAANALWGDLAFLYEPKHPLFIVGPATLVVYWGGTVATTGFCSADILAVPSSPVTVLS